MLMQFFYRLCCVDCWEHGSEVPIAPCPLKVHEAILSEKLSVKETQVVCRKKQLIR